MLSSTLPRGGTTTSLRLAIVPPGFGRAVIQVDNEPVARTIPMRLPGGKPASGTYLVNMSLDLEAGLPWMWLPVLERPSTG